QGLLTLIDEILDLSRIEAGKMEVDFQVVSVREVTNDLQSLFAPLAKDKGLDFMINIAPDVSAKIETDKMKLDQILRNLISNALKFTATGYVKLDVRQTGNEPSMLEFCVVD